jgi:hypothetical protein
MLTKKTFLQPSFRRRAFKFRFPKECSVMSDKVWYWVSMVFGGLALLFLVANVCLINSNRNLQTDLAQRQNAINNAPNLNQLNQALVQALAQASVNNQDKEIGDLLNSQGITIKPKGATAADADKKK